MLWDIESVHYFEGATPEMIATLRRLVAEEMLHEAKASEQFAERLAAIQAERRLSLRQLATDRQWRKYQRLHRRRIGILSRLRERVGESPEAASELVEMRRTSIERSLKLFERETIDVEAIKRIYQKFDQKLLSAFEEFLGRKLPLQEMKGEMHHGT